MASTKKALRGEASKLKAVSQNKSVEKRADLTEAELEQQEHLSKERLKSLIAKYNWDDTSSNRPRQNLVDLMHWAKNTFAEDLSVTDALNCYIHNKIVIDGGFLQFCDEHGVKVKCLMKDSVASWKTEFNAEHFMAQGVFKITYKKLEFLHCALFHKGNQNEDEVSFFIIVSDNMFHDYVEFRNKFDKWLQDRDRDHLEIHVVGGEGYPYTRDTSWDDLFLPDKLKKEIRQSVEGFLNAREIYEGAKIPWKTGLLFYGLPGLGKTSTIRTIISQYNFKPVTVQSGSQTNDDTITEAFAYAQSQEPGLLYIEDLDTLLGSYVTLSHFLQMMDGVTSKNGIMVIATANDITRLQESVTDRPSRFDRKWEFPLPDYVMTEKYLKKWFGNLLTEDEYKEIIKECVENKFSYAYLKDIYITAAYYALSNNRKTANVDDVMAAVDQLLLDKEQVRNNFDNSDESEIGISF